MDRISIRAGVAWDFVAEETREKGRVLTFRRTTREGKPWLVIEKRKPRASDDRSATAEEWLDALYSLGAKGGPREVLDEGDKFDPRRGAL